MYLGGRPSHVRCAAPSLVQLLINAIDLSTALADDVFTLFDNSGCGDQRRGCVHTTRATIWYNTFGKIMSLNLHIGVKVII